jgi:glycosyltransferase involved in cell wall biosynthesis
MKTAHPLNKLRLIPFFIFADKLIVTAKEEKDYLARKLPFVNPKLRIIPLGSNIQVRAISESEKERIRLNFGATKNDILVSHFGYMLPNKKIEILLHAFKHLLDNGLCAKLMMISDFSPLNNRYHAQLKKIADELSLNKFIIWTGYLNPETVSKYLSASDINIQLYADGVSYRRGSLLAALSHGLAIITNAAGELPEGLIDHYNVLAFTLKNPQELVTAFKELAESKALREKISNNAKDLAKKFSWENIAKEHFELYESLYVRAAKNASFITRTYKVRRSV